MKENEVTETVFVSGLYLDVSWNSLLSSKIKKMDARAVHHLNVQPFIPYSTFDRTHIYVITTGNLRNIFRTFYIFFSYLTYVITSFKLRKIVDQIISFKNRLLISKNKRHLIRFERFSLVCVIIWQVLYTSNSFAYQVMICFGNETHNFDRINYWIDPPENSFVHPIIYDSFLVLSSSMSRMVSSWQRWWFTVIKLT